MRLLEYRNGAFKAPVIRAGNLPRYAVLSHTWGPDADEVTYKDLVDGTGDGKAGYEEIRFCAGQAQRDGLRYIWVDTCCIDKTSSTELQEAITSMFQWYKKADRCYVYLSDVAAPEHKDDDEDDDDEKVKDTWWEPAFRASKLFTRGWTLQELVAPASVEFFTRNGQRLGDKRSLEQPIHEITGIALSALRGTDLAQFDVEERFKWAEKRLTTREEDWAYSLLGIFGVFLPLIYGEGKAHAVRRLNQEIANAARSHTAHEDVIDLLSTEFEDEGRYVDIQNPVATTWLISFEQIRQRDPLAADYLSFAACVDAKDIPLSLLPPGLSPKT
ncbi:Heterokaryon incompatibility [Niveomyces insectorum RCEF 264]|uniref:Heterokaryon incompatibility n=1 Tax=Niveomyces insectorum RCEF 264 TaxID=1081102 RepID=A0A167U5I0_9HYPO|nr:Heterokaryon incompatibility [Niveomyces insectorum RCEF 264]